MINKKTKDLKMFASNMQTHRGLIWFRFKKNKLGIIGLLIIALLFLVCFTAPLYVNYADVIEQDISRAFIRPCAEYPFGTDQYGRDLFARVTYGGIISLTSGFAVVGMSLLGGLLLGGLAGYFGGKADMIIMRALDIFMSVPAIMLQMAIIVTLGQTTFNLFIALAITMMPGMARLVRSTIMTVRDREYVDAARCYGSSSLRIMVKHILPNGIGPVIVSSTLMLGTTILAISGMGFIGLGIAPPTPEWGTILAESRNFVRYYPYLGLIPGLAIGIAVMALNFVGDGLRDALDPRTKK